MPSISTQQKINTFVKLAEQLQKKPDAFLQLINSANSYNAWFTPANVTTAINAITVTLTPENLNTWLKPYEKQLNTNEQLKKVGLILAGNIPLVGFHDVLSVLMSGNIAMIKLSSQDAKLLPYITNLLYSIEPAFKERIIYTERIADIDAIIATGSTNSSRYFEYYFGKYPHIIRNNRNSVGIINGNESKTDFEQLGNDIFQYFGLGCRNVSKLYVPENYDFSTFYEGIEPFNYVKDHFKYNNNYEYNRTLLLMNKVTHLDNQFLMISENHSLASPMASLHYEYYQNEKDLEKKILTENENIQCIVSKDAWFKGSFAFGKSQEPALSDYADGVDTMAFLLNL